MSNEMRYDEQDLMACKTSGLFREDAGESVFFAQELQKVKAKTYDVKTPANNAMSIFPVTSEADPGADTVAFDSYDSVGMAKIITNYADDLPRADVKAQRTIVKVFDIATSYGYSIKDIRRAKMTGKPLTTRKAESARRANDALVNKIAFQGDAEHGILGIFKHPNITKYVLPADGEGSATTWDKKTPVQILRDMNNAVSMIVDITKGVEIPDTILLPIDKYNIIATTLLPDSGEQTILSFFQEKNPYIQTIKSIHEASGAGTGGKDIMFIYRNDENALSLEIPLPFEQLAPQRKNLEMVIPCDSSTAGVMVYYPLSICMAEGI